jgi:hypothetical protein
MDGTMVLHLNYFFPATQARVKKVLGLIDMDTENRDEILTAIADNLQERIQDYSQKDQRYLEKLKKNLEIVEEWRARGE